MYSAGDPAEGEFGTGGYGDGPSESLPYAVADYLGSETDWRSGSGVHGKKKGVGVSWLVILGVAGTAVAYWQYQDQLRAFLSGLGAPTTGGMGPDQAANDGTDPETGKAMASDLQTEDSDATAAQNDADIEDEAPAQKPLTAPTINKAVVEKRGRRGKFVTLSLDWSEVEDVDGYQLQLSRSPGFKAPAVDVEVKSPTLKKKHVRANVRYARVRARQQDTWSPYSEVVVLKTKRSSRKRRGRNSRMRFR